MASFLDMEPEQRRMYVARMMNLDPSAPDTWPSLAIERVIARAEEAADRTVADEVRKLTRS